MIHTGTVSADSLIIVARDLRSEHGENPEYDRALVELVAFALGYTSDDIDHVHGLIMEDMTMEPIASADAARDKAIAWQHWASEQTLSYGELADWGTYFEDLADRFGLVEEFKEEGII